MLRTPTIILCAALVAAAAGCAKKPADIPVSASTPSALTSWTSMLSSKVTPQLHEELRDALLEERLEMSRLRPSLKAPEIQEEVCKKIDGMRLQDFLIRARQFKKERLEGERDLYQKSYKALQETTVKGAEMNRSLENQREITKARLDKLNAGIEANDKRLAELRDGKV